MTEEEFLHTVKWKRKREKILKRDKWLCQECARYGKMVRATIVHHIREYEDAPELALADENLESLCMECHNHKHPNRNRNNGRPPVNGRN